MKKNKEKSNYIRLTTFLVLTLAALFSFSSFSYAFDGGMNNGVFAIAPHFEKDDALTRSWITYQVPVGKTIEDAVDIQNISNSKISVKVNFVEAANPDKNNFIVKGDTEEKQLIAKWTILKTEPIISLNPGEIKKIPLAINVPNNTKPGEYWGGVVAEETNESLQQREDLSKQGKQVLIKTRLVIRTLAKVTDLKDAKTERLLLATKPYIENNQRLNFFERLSSLNLAAKLYLFFASFYLGISFFYFIYSLFLGNKLKNNKHVWIYVVTFILILMGVLRILPMNSEAGLVSVLNASQNGAGLSIGPAATLDSEGNIKDRPSWFIYNGNPGDVISGTAVVVNHDDSPNYGVAYGVDASLTEDGGFALNSKDEEKYDIGKWVNIPEPNFYIAAQASKAIPFTINLPNDLAPGDHIGGIVVQVDADAKKKEAIAEGKLENSSNVQIVTRVGARIYLTASGETILSSESTDFSVDEKGDGWAVKFTMKNTGNVKFKPAVNLLLKDENGTNVKDPYLAPQYTEMFPGKLAKITVALPWKNIKPGKYKLIVQVSDSKNQTEKSLDFEIYNYGHNSATVITQQVVAMAPAHVATTTNSNTPVWVFIVIIAISLLLLIIFIIILILIILKKKNQSSVNVNSEQVNKQLPVQQNAVIDNSSQQSTKPTIEQK